MLAIDNQRYFDEVKAFAEARGLLPKLQEQLDYLGVYAYLGAWKEPPCSG